MSENFQMNFKETISLFFQENKRLFIAIGAAVLGCFFLIVHFQTAPGPKEYITAEKAVEAWKLSKDQKSYMIMRKSLKKIPSLEKKYAAFIAQELLDDQRFSEAVHIAEKSLSNLRSDAPYHASFGETSLLIEKGCYQDALEKAVHLKTIMAENLRFPQKMEGYAVGGTLLYAQNLLRIACLQKQLKNRPGERSAWEELEAFLEGKEDIASSIYESFQDRDLNLSHYIAERKKQL